jgi:hypothetical protein
MLNLARTQCFARFIFFGVVVKLHIVLIALIAVACNPFAQPVATRAPIIIPTLAPTQPPPIATASPAPIANTPTLAPVIATSTRAAQPVPTQTPAEIKRITFAPGATSATMQGALAANGMDRYVLRALAGQMMTINFAPSAENLTIQISGADGNVLVSGGAKFTTGTFQLALTQDYFITVISARAPPANYTLQVSIPPLATPGAQAKRITFTPGRTSATLQENLATSDIARFVFRVLAGQTLTVNATAPQTKLLLAISGEDGQVLKSAGVGSANWSGILPATQDYFLAISAENGAATPFTLQITLSPIAPPQASRITFAPGAMSATVRGSIAAGEIERLVLRALAGQTMSVAVTSNPPDKVIVVIFGADGNVLISDHATTPTWSGTLPLTQDYFIDLKPYAGIAADYTLVVTIPPR